VAELSRRASGALGNSLRLRLTFPNNYPTFLTGLQNDGRIRILIE